VFNFAAEDAVPAAHLTHIIFVIEEEVSVVFAGIAFTRRFRDGVQVTREILFP
jgi:hypothetical protein